MKITISPGITTPEKCDEIEVEDVIKQIKSDSLKPHTDYLRKENDKVKRNEYKKNKLPIVMWSGIFNYRGKNNLEQTTGLACYDIDDITPVECERIKQEICKDTHTFCAFVSPSGGLKFVVKIPETHTPEEFYNTYKEVAKYYAKFNVKLDVGTCDVSRACFMSYDPEAYYNPDSKRIVIQKADRSKEEYALACKLWEEGLTHKEVYARLLKCEKFAERDDAYRQNTINKALEEVKKNKAIKKTPKKEKAEKIKIKRSAGWCNEKEISEVVCDGEKSKFCVYNKVTKEITYCTELITPDGVVKPYSPSTDEEISKAKQAVILPSEPTEYNTDEELDKEILNFCNKWFDADEKFMAFALWNIKRSWVYDKFYTLNYLDFLGDYGGGKTRGLDTIGGLHYKAMFLSGGSSPAATFRLINKWKGSVIMDEADFKFSDETADMIKIFTQGYERGKSIMRCNDKDISKLEFFDPFCPKVYAHRREFTDKAVASRSITKVMTGTEREDIPVSLNAEFYAERQKLQNKLLMWRFRNHEKIHPKIEDKDILKDMVLEPRTKQIVCGLIPMFTHTEKHLEVFKDFVQGLQNEIIMERQESYEGRIVNTICEMLKNNPERHITASSIIENGEFVNKHYEPIKPRALTKYFKILGLKVGKAVFIDGKTIKPLIIDEGLKLLAKKYGVPLPITNITILSDFPFFGNNTDSNKNVVDITKGAPFPNNGNNGNSVINSDGVQPKIEEEDVE